MPGLTEIGPVILGEEDFLLLDNKIPLENDVGPYLNKLNSLHAGMLCAKFG